MTDTHIIVLILYTLMTVSCIEEYAPQIEAGESNKYVVSGQLSTDQEYQIITVSIASSINDPKQIPLNDCIVKIVDINGNSFNGSEIKGGGYKIYVPAEYQIIGSSYRLEILTPAGTELMSEYEALLPCPDIDSVYFVKESLPTSDPDVFTEGIQFYLNLDAPDKETGYYKFEIEETWEYHSAYPLQWYFDGTLHQIIPRDKSHNICWANESINGIYILNTAELQKNTFMKYPLHFVDNTTQRLAYMYSVLVKLHTINENTYVFWDQLRVNHFENGSLYETQPLPVLGNMANVTHPEQSVLGYFQVSSVKTKRVFIQDVSDLEIRYQQACGKYLLRYGLLELTPDVYNYPVYLFIDRGAVFEMTPDCIFCELQGGTTTRPDYWPDKK